MNCQSLFYSKKMRKNIMNLLSTEVAQGVVKIKQPSSHTTDHSVAVLLLCFLGKFSSGVRILS